MEFSEAMHCLKRLFPAAVESALAETVNDLLARYGEPERRYHTPALLARRLVWFQLVRYQADRPDALELAIWYAAAVCSPDGGGVEASARLCREVAARFERQDIAELAETLVLCQAGYLAGGQHHMWDEQLFLDICEADVGAAPESYRVYAEQLATEHGDSELVLGLAGRHPLMRARLQGSWLFRTRPFRARLEEQARRNLAALRQPEALSP